MIAALAMLFTAGVAFAGAGLGYAVMGALECDRRMGGLGAGLAVAGLALLVLTMEAAR